MDPLKDIIQTLTNTEIKEFQKFINTKKIGNRKDTALFDLLHQSDHDRKEIIKELYPDNNKNAYHSLRKRLIKQITDFIIIKNNREDITTSSSIMNGIALAKYLFVKKQMQSAWHYLKKAENLAIAAQEYQLLNNIYFVQIEYSDSEFALPIRSIIKKKKGNLKLAQEDDRANTANQLIKYKLKEARTKGEEFDIDKVVNNVLHENNLGDEIFHRPKLMFNIISIIRSNILAKKDFLLFESYVINSYNKLNKRKVFDQHSHYYKLQFLYIIAHVLYRNLKFKEAEQYTSLLHEEIQKFNKVFYTLMYPSYVLLLCNILGYTGRVAQGTELLERLLKSPKVKLDKIQRIFACLNLASYYGFLGNYSQAIKTMATVQHSDNWLINNIGTEHSIKMRILECILCHENEDYDYVDYRIRSIEKIYKDELIKPIFLGEKNLVSIIKKLNKNTEVITESAFIKEVNNLITAKPAPIYDLQSTVLYLWVKAKIENTSYEKALSQMLD